MTSNNEIKELIESARKAGGVVLVTYDQDAMIFEGREIIETIQVIGLKGCGPMPMPALSGAERIREILAR